MRHAPLQIFEMDRLFSGRNPSFAQNDIDLRIVSCYDLSKQQLEKVSLDFTVGSTMQFVAITAENFEELIPLQKAYKEEIGECAPTNAELESLKKAIEDERIHFYGCVCDNSLVACCSICYIYSTFQYGTSGVFEDFYIQPEYRHKGIARMLVSYAYEQSGVGSLMVGCADCDKQMYRAIGFQTELGNLLALEKKQPRP